MKMSLPSMCSHILLWNLALLTLLTGCLPEIQLMEIKRDLPPEFAQFGDPLASQHQSANGPLPATPTTATKVGWKDYFADSYLVALIDTALLNNQELTIFTQELEIAKNEIGARQGAYLPKIELGAAAGAEKVGDYTRDGAVEANNPIAPGKTFPQPLPNYSLGALATWEVDIWRKLRDAEKSALMRYLASAEGRNFMVTNLIAEIASTYFELLSLDNQLDILRKNIQLQTNAVEIVRLKKESARVTELALRRFEAQLFKTRSLSFDVSQKIIEAENKINFLIGRYPQPVQRNSQIFSGYLPTAISAGTPLELLENRPDIRQAELEVSASDLDINVAKARFYPSLSISSAFGYSAYDTAKLIETPQSMLYSVAGGLTLPFINRMEIEAMYRNASAKQIQSVISYQRTVLQACVEVSNQLSNIYNLQENYQLKSQQVKALDKSVEISTTLFNSARADYMEVLLTQREALESKFDLIETKQRQLNAAVGIYRALGGGWNS